MKLKRFIIAAIGATLASAILLTSNRSGNRPLKHPESFQYPAQAGSVKPDQSRSTGFRVQSPASATEISIRIAGSFPNKTIPSGQLLYDVFDYGEGSRSASAEIKNSTAQIPIAHTPKLAPIAVIIAEEAFYIQEFDSKKGRIIAAPTVDSLIIAENEIGEQIKDVTTYIDRQSFAFRGPIESEIGTYKVGGGISHPGRLQAEHLQSTAQNSPFWLKKRQSPLGDTPVWLTAPGLSPLRIENATPHNNMRKVRMIAGSQITVGLTNTRSPMSYFATISYTDGSFISFDPFPASELSIFGLPAGRATLAISSLDDTLGDAIIGIPIHLSTSTPLFIEAPLDLKSLVTGHLSGELSFPEAWPESVKKESVYLKIFKTRRQDGSRIESPKMRIVRTTRILSAPGQLRGWEFGEASPGGYRVEVVPTGHFEDVFVGTSESAYVRMTCPVLSNVLVQFRQAPSNAKVDVQIQSSSRFINSHGIETMLSPGALVQPLPNVVGKFSITGKPGSILVSGTRSTGGDFSRIISLPVNGPDLDKDIVLPQLAWIDLEFQVGDKQGLWDWQGGIEAWSNDEALFPSSYRMRPGSISLCAPVAPSVQLVFTPTGESESIPSIQLNDYVPNDMSPGEIPHVSIIISKNVNRITWQKL